MILRVQGKNASSDFEFGPHRVRLDAARIPYVNDIPKINLNLIDSISVAIRNVRRFRTFTPSLCRILTIGVLASSSDVDDVGFIYLKNEEKNNNSFHFGLHSNSISLALCDSSNCQLFCVRKCIRMKM